METPAGAIHEAIRTRPRFRRVAADINLVVCSVLFSLKQRSVTHRRQFGIRIDRLTSREIPGQLRSVTEIAEVAWLRKRPVTLILRLDVAISITVSHRQSRDNRVQSAPIRSADQIAFRRSKEHKQIRIVWLGPVVTTAGVRLDPKILRPICLQLGFGESVLKPNRHPLHVERAGPSGVLSGVCRRASLCIRHKRKKRKRRGKHCNCDASGPVGRCQIQGTQSQGTQTRSFPLNEDQNHPSL